MSLCLCMSLNVSLFIDSSCIKGFNCVITDIASEETTSTLRGGSVVNSLKPKKPLVTGGEGRA